MGFNSYANSNWFKQCLKYSADNVSEVLFEAKGEEFPDEWIWHAYRGGSDCLCAMYMMYLVSTKSI